MAWPVDDSEANDSPEAVQENVSSSTDHVNVPPARLQNIYAYGAVGFSHTNEGQHSNLLPFRQYLLEMRQHRILNPYLSRIRNRRYSSGDINQRNVQMLRNSENNFIQRHSVPCCHINPGVRHSCCDHLNRPMSLEILDLHRRNSFPLNPTQDYFNTRELFSANENYTVNEFGVDYGRRGSFQADSHLQQSVAAVGPEFFLRFLADEMEQRGLQLPDDMHRGMSCHEMPQSFIYLMERFSVSLEREMIIGLALRVPFPLSWSSFVVILDGLNKGTPCPERIVTLFFFCGDLAIRAFCENDTLFREIVSWTQCYLREIDSSVLVPSQKPSYKIAVTACLVGVIAIFVLMKLN